MQNAVKQHVGHTCSGSDLQEVRGQAYAHWLAAAGQAGAHQAAAFAKLGLWYADFKADMPRARKCFQRGLGLDPLQAEAGQPRILLTPHARSLSLTPPPPPHPIPPRAWSCCPPCLHQGLAISSVVASIGCKNELQSLPLAVRAMTLLSLRLELCWLVCPVSTACASMCLSHTMQLISA